MSVSTQRSQLLLLCFVDPMLLLQFVKQESRKQVILYSLWPMLIVFNHELRENLRDLFGDQSKLHRLRAVVEFAAVAKCHRTQSHEPLARVRQVGNVFLVAGGGRNGAQLPIAVNHDGASIVDSGRPASNAGDEGSSMIRADANCIRVSRN